MPSMPRLDQTRVPRPYSSFLIQRKGPPAFEMIAGLGDSHRGQLQATEYDARKVGF